MSSRPELKLDWCTHEAAKYAVENWHYSETMPVSKSAKVGVWEEGKFIGTVIYALGANPHLGSPYGLKQFEAAELVRVALMKHKTPVSRILRIAQTFIKQQSPGLRLLVSYADTEQGHHGGIYQASGWIYRGTTPAKVDFICNGKKLQRRAYTGKNFGNVKMQLPPGTNKVASPHKHCYLMPLDDEMRKQIEPLRKPYPKRVRSVDSDTSANHAEKNGANPTRTLSTSSPASSGQHPDIVSDRHQ
jgi:hypothetical protein